MQKNTQTQTSTYARHIAAKVAADLKRLQIMAGSGIPSDKRIADYQAEMSMLLHEGYLGEITYGFKQDDQWVIALKYLMANKPVTNAVDTVARLLQSEGKEGLLFTSTLSSPDFDAVKKALESIQVYRIPSEEPDLPDSAWEEAGQYASGKLGVRCMVAAMQANK